MSNPKEKAQELVSSFMSIKNIKLSDYSVIYLPAAKQCALISVNEMLNEYTGQCPKDSWEMERHLYWKEIKQEIENLW